MIDVPAFCGRAGVALQLAMAGAVLIIGSATPPAHGRLLLLPLSSHSVDARLLAQAGMTRIGAGPLPGSLVVEGPGFGLAPRFLEEGVLMLAAPAALCTATQES